MENEKEAFKSVLPEVISSLQNDPKFFEMPEAAYWMKKVFCIIYLCKGHYTISEM